MRQNIIQGLKWNTVNQIFSLGSKFIVTIVLSRLLEPRDFGLTAMILAFTVVADVFIDAGFKSSIVQEQNITNNDLSSIYILNIAIGFFFTVLIILSAPFIASFYKEPLLQDLTVAVAFIYIINPLGLIHEALLTRDLKFKTLTMSQMVSKVTAAVIGIYMAYTGWGYWSLVISTLAGALFRNVFLWFQCTWRPSLHFRFSDLGKYWKVSSNILYSNILFNVVNRIDYVIIGKFLSPGVLGMYSRSKENAFIPGSIIANVIRSTFFGIFSSLKNNMDRLRNLYTSASQLIVIALAAIFSFFIIYAREIIIIIFGDKWLGMTLMFQCYCVYVFIYCNTILRVYLLNALGRTDIDFKVGLFSHPLRFVILLMPFFFAGQVNVYYFIAINSLFILAGLLVYEYYIIKLLNMRVWESFRFVPLLFSYFVLVLLVITFVKFESIVLIIIAKALVYALGSLIIVGLYYRQLIPLIKLVRNRNV